MFIGKRNRHVVAAAGIFAATICFAFKADATSIITPSQPERPIVLAALTPAEQQPEPIVRAASFAERFDVLPRVASFTERFDVIEASLLDRVLTSPAYRAPVFHVRQHVPAGEPLDGAASTYDPTDPADHDAGDMNTASGETYDPEGWTAAIRTDLRDQFGGVRYGRNYRPTFALVEAAGKRAIVKINDVGPLRPGRIIDLNKRAMKFFDPTLQIGVIGDVKVTPLANANVAVGPVENLPAFASSFATAWN
jgi:rare lipoprotein A